MSRGPDIERQWRDDLASALGITVVTPMLSHIAALKALNVKRVGVATYYGPELQESLREYLARFGIEAVVFPGYGSASQSSDLYATSLSTLDGVGYQDVYRYCRSNVPGQGSPIDAIYINGGGWDAEAAVSLLEADLRLKVVWGPAAELWATYETLSIHVAIPGAGTLLGGTMRIPRGGSHSVGIPSPTPKSKATASTSRIS
jgi:maleate cis-trans isomerase